MSEALGLIATYPLVVAAGILVALLLWAQFREKWLRQFYSGFKYRRTPLIALWMLLTIAWSAQQFDPFLHEGSDYINCLPTVFVRDASLSMLGGANSPNQAGSRGRRADSLMKEVIEKCSGPKSQFGIITFADTALVQSALVKDKVMLGMMLESFIPSEHHLREPSSSLSVALAALADNPGLSATRVAVILSDGADSSTKEQTAMTSALVSLPIVEIIVVGFGYTNTQEKIPVWNKDGTFNDYLRWSKDKRIVVPPFNVANLLFLAEKGGGVYFSESTVDLTEKIVARLRVGMGSGATKPALNPAYMISALVFTVAVFFVSFSSIRHST